MKNALMRFPQFLKWHYSLKMVRGAGLEPTNLSVLGPKPSAFANFASRARR